MLDPVRAAVPGSARNSCLRQRRDAARAARIDLNLDEKPSKSGLSGGVHPVLPVSVSVGPHEHCSELNTLSGRGADSLAACHTTKHAKYACDSPGLAQGTVASFNNPQARAASLSLSLRIIGCSKFSFGAQANGPRQGAEPVSEELVKFDPV